MNMILFIGFMVAFAFLIKAILSVPIGNSSATMSTEGSEVSKVSITADYVGGISNILERTKCTLILMKDKINLRIDFKNIDLLIDFGKIIGIKVLNASELFTYMSEPLYVSKSYTNNSETEFYVISYLDAATGSEQKLVLKFGANDNFLEKYEEIYSGWYHERSVESSCTYDYKTGFLFCSIR